MDIRQQLSDHSKLVELRRDRQLVDTELLAAGGSVAAHQVVLASQSDFFQACFRHAAVFKAGGAASSPVGSVGRVNLEHIPVDVLETLVDAIYTGSLRITHQNALDMFSCANELGMRSLVVVCQQFISEHMSELDACAVFGRAVYLAHRTACPLVRDAARCIYERISCFTVGRDLVTELVQLDFPTFRQLIDCLRHFGTPCDDLTCMLIGWLARDYEERARNVEELVSAIPFSSDLILLSAHACAAPCMRRHANVQAATPDGLDGVPDTGRALNAIPRRFSAGTASSSCSSCQAGAQFEGPLGSPSAGRRVRIHYSAPPSPSLPALSPNHACACCLGGHEQNKPFSFGSPREGGRGTCCSAADTHVGVEAAQHCAGPQGLDPHSLAAAELLRWACPAACCARAALADERAVCALSTVLTVALRRTNYDVAPTAQLQPGLPYRRHSDQQGSAGADRRAAEGLRSELDSATRAAGQSGLAGAAAAEVDGPFRWLAGQGAAQAPGVSAALHTHLAAAGRDVPQRGMGTDGCGEPPGGGAQRDVAMSLGGEVPRRASGEWHAAASNPCGAAMAAAFADDGRKQELLVVGGHDSRWHPVTRTGVYDPARDQWRELTCNAVSAPFCRVGRVGGGAPLLLADTQQSLHQLREGGQAGGWAWVPVPNICCAEPCKALYSAVATSERRLWLLGGVCGRNEVIAKTSYYMTDMELWTAGPELQVPRFCAAAAACGSSVLVCGGQDRSRVVSEVELFDQERGWLLQKPLLEARKYHCVVPVRRRFYCLGGKGSECSGRVPEVEALDPREGVWRVVSSMPSPRSSFGCVYLHGKIYVLGGNDWNATASDCVQAFCPYMQRWTDCSSMPWCSRGLGACVL